MLKLFRARSLAEAEQHLSTLQTNLNQERELLQEVKQGIRSQISKGSRFDPILVAPYRNLLSNGRTHQTESVSDQQQALNAQLKSRLSRPTFNNADQWRLAKEQDKNNATRNESADNKPTSINSKLGAMFGRQSQSSRSHRNESASVSIDWSTVSEADKDQLRHALHTNLDYLKTLHEQLKTGIKVSTSDIKILEHEVGPAIKTLKTNQQQLAYCERLLNNVRSDIQRLSSQHDDLDAAFKSGNRTIRHNNATSADCYEASETEGEALLSGLRYQIEQLQQQRHRLEHQVKQFSQRVESQARQPLVLPIREIMPLPRLSLQPVILPKPRTTASSSIEHLEESKDSPAGRPMSFSLPKRPNPLLASLQTATLSKTPKPGISGLKAAIQQRVVTPAVLTNESDHGNNTLNQDALEQKVSDITTALEALSEQYTQAISSIKSLSQQNNERQRIFKKQLAALDSSEQQLHLRKQLASATQNELTNLEQRLKEIKLAANDGTLLLQNESGQAIEATKAEQTALMDGLSYRISNLVSVTSQQDQAYQKALKQQSELVESEIELAPREVISVGKLKQQIADNQQSIEKNRTTIRSIKQQQSKLVRQLSSLDPIKLKELKQQGLLPQSLNEQAVHSSKNSGNSKKPSADFTKELKQRACKPNFNNAEQWVTVPNNDI